MTKTKQPERPINCGTGYCSCIECPYEQAQPEPVYQYQLTNGNWIDQTKESHDYNVRHGQASLRTLYTAIKQGGATEQAQPEKPIAYFDFQERGFYWAPNIAIGPVPVARKVEPMPLYSSQQAQPEPALQQADIAQGLSEQHRGAIAYQLTLRLVVDMPTARAAVDAAHGIKQGGQHD